MTSTLRQRLLTKNIQARQTRRQNIQRELVEATRELEQCEAELSQVEEKMVMTKMPMPMMMPSDDNTTTALYRHQLLHLLHHDPSEDSASSSSDDEDSSSSDDEDSSSHASTNDVPSRSSSPASSFDEAPPSEASSTEVADTVLRIVSSVLDSVRPRLHTIIAAAHAGEWRKVCRLWKDLRQTLGQEDVVEMLALAAQYKPVQDMGVQDKGMSRGRRASEKKRR
ncbi:unnamed protein product [Zymoseptoria tritici ST99CH_1E4]|uniref:Uncharacterized protein n=1 Tax=Zymoseptoria tritici ST99CH_1E4 TaxID=1276532 RepID=A0A2H1H9L1_ZYMTR|nr:unnamed protein product [Zymoseptoria tritici ST99CH_1E4]